MVTYLENHYVQQVACGFNHTVILVDPYHIYACGQNKYGELGIGNLETQMVFTHVGSIKGKNVVGIVAGGSHSFFLIDFDEPDILNYEEAPKFNISKVIGGTRQNFYS